MINVPGYALAAVTLLTGVTVDLNAAAAVTLIAALVAAYPSYKLLSANRRKVLTEAGQIADARVLAYSERVDRENTRLRERIVKVEGKLDATEHRCDVLERLLIEHGLPVPGH